MSKFPVGGPRAPVYAFLRARGWVMCEWSDKHWTRADGAELTVYGAGSMARIVLNDKTVIERPLAEIDDTQAEQETAVYDRYFQP